MSACEALEIAIRVGADELGQSECRRLAVRKPADIANLKVSSPKSAGSWDPAFFGSF